MWGHSPNRRRRREESLISFGSVSARLKISDALPNAICVSGRGQEIKTFFDGGEFVRGNKNGLSLSVARDANRFALMRDLVDHGGKCATCFFFGDCLHVLNKPHCSRAVKESQRSC